MKVSDLFGCTITVTDLETAIKQAANFKDCHHVPYVSSDSMRQEYWKDMYAKLQELKSSYNTKINITSYGH